jgi:hypothetical protein
MPLVGTKIATPWLTSRVGDVDSGARRAMHVRHDGVGQTAPREVQVVVRTQLSFGGKAAHRAGDERIHLAHPFGVDIDVAERLLACLDPTASPRLKLSGRAWVEPFQLDAIARKGGAV